MEQYSTVARRSSGSSAITLTTPTLIIAGVVLLAVVIGVTLLAFFMGKQNCSSSPRQCQPYKDCPVCPTCPVCKNNGDCPACPEPDPCPACPSCPPCSGKNGGENGGENGEDSDDTPGDDTWKCVDRVSCSMHGSCEDDKCVCDKGFKGQKCETEIPCASVGQAIIQSDGTCRQCCGLLSPCNVNNVLKCYGHEDCKAKKGVEFTDAQKQQLATICKSS